MKYAQLKPAAKERARQWFKDSEAEMWGSDNAPDYYEDMATCLKFLGITVSKDRSEYHDGKGNRRSTEKYDFEWSGFWSQGDGLVFRGSWDARDVDMTGLMAYAPKDETLKRIAIQMTAVMLRHPMSSADITTVSYGPGLPAMHIEGHNGVDENEDDLPMDDEDADALKVQVFAAAHWCYKQLEDNYNYDTSDEAAADGIEANDYDFDRDGDVIVRRQRVPGTKCPKAVAA